MNSGIPVRGQCPCKAQKQEKIHWTAKNQFIYSHQHIPNLAQYRTERGPVGLQVLLWRKERVNPLIDPDTNFIHLWTPVSGLPGDPTTRPEGKRWLLLQMNRYQHKVMRITKNYENTTPKEQKSSNYWH